MLVSTAIHFKVETEGFFNERVEQVLVIDVLLLLLEFASDQIDFWEFSADGLQSLHPGMPISSE